MGKKLWQYSKDEKVALLKRDVEEWNRLREEEPRLKPDLSNVNLAGAQLLGANLAKANLVVANLRGANLENAHLSRANLADANLEDANLVYAKLGGANFEGAILVRANLRYANLLYANLADADLEYADLKCAYLEYAYLSGAKLARANFAGANLKAAKLKGSHLVATNVAMANLEGIQGPFNLDEETINISGSLPKNFLMASGVPESLAGHFQNSGSTVTITFTREVWGQLLPIESALSSFLDDQYIIEKGKDRITVQVPSPELVEDTLQAIMPVLASLQREAPGNLEGLEVSPEGGKKEALTKAELIEVLQAFGGELVDQMKGPALTTGEEVALEYYKKIPGLGPSHPILRKAFERRGEQPSKVQRIFQRFTRFFRATNDVMAIPGEDEPKQLEQGED